MCRVLAGVSLGKCLYNHLFLFKKQAVSRVRTKEKGGIESRQKDSLLTPPPHLPSTQDLVQVRKPGPSNPSLLRASVGQHPAGLQDLQLLKKEPGDSNRDINGLLDRGSCTSERKVLEGDPTMYNKQQAVHGSDLPLWRRRRLLFTGGIDL